MSRTIQQAPNINLAKLEVGKTYEFHLRDKRIKVGELQFRNRSSGYPYRVATANTLDIFTKTGSFYHSGTTSPNDIIEIKEPPKPLNIYIVWYLDKDSNVSEGFRCHAESENHAKEQTLNAYPDLQVILRVEQQPS